MFRLIICLFLLAFSSQVSALTFKSGETLDADSPASTVEEVLPVDLSKADPNVVEAQMLLQRFGYVKKSATGKWNNGYSKALKQFYRTDLNKSYTGSFSQNALNELRRRRLITMPQQAPITFAEERYDISHLSVKNSFSHLTDKPRYKLHQFGFTAVSSDEIAPPYCYPSPQDCRDEPQVFSPDPHKAVTGDFNGDGFEDIAVSWIYFNHTMPREETPSHIRFYLNDRNGNLVSAPEIYKDGVMPLRHMLYRMEVKDFNGDGVDDLFAGSMGVMMRVKDSGILGDFEPYILLLSDGAGGVYDASHQIQGQENGGLITGGGFAHDAAAGDINCDGYPDIYAGRKLLINDGVGNFSNATNELPNGMGLYTQSPKGTAVIEDFNGDGCGDLATFDFDGDGHVWLSRNGKHENRKFLSINYNRKHGKKNTMVNHSATGDIDGDGAPELLIALGRKDPYYLGRSISILKFENNQFSDVSDNHINDVRDLEGQQYLQSHSEGNLQLRDHDNDGDLDILDSTGASPELKGRFGYTIFENDGSGQFTQIPQTEMVYLNEFMIDGWERNRLTIDMAHPINIDNQGTLDYVSFIFTPWREDNAGRIGYTVLGK